MGNKQIEYFASELVRRASRRVVHAGHNGSACVEASTQTRAHNLKREVLGDLRGLNDGDGVRAAGERIPFPAISFTSSNAV